MDRRFQAGGPCFLVGTRSQTICSHKNEMCLQNHSGLVVLDSSDLPADLMEKYAAAAGNHTKKPKS